MKNSAAITTPLKDALKASISTYWWNMGELKKDYSGTLEGCLKSRDINVKMHTARSLSWVTVSFSIGQREYHITSKDQDRFRIEEFLVDAVQMFMTYLGDSAIIVTSRGSLIRMNWPTKDSDLFLSYEEDIDNLCA
jgi:hypothetical protein